MNQIDHGGGRTIRTWRDTWGVTRGQGVCECEPS